MLNLRHPKIVKTFNKSLQKFFTTISPPVIPPHFPYKFKGIGNNIFTEGNQINKQIVQQYIGGHEKVKQFVTSSYRNIINSFKNKDGQYISMVCQQKLKKQIMRIYQMDMERQLEIVNEYAEVQYKIHGCKVIIGINCDRNLHGQTMIKLGESKENCFGLYFANSRKLNNQKLPCLIQTNILYKSHHRLLKSTSKLLPKQLNTDQQNQNTQQTHMIQFQTQGSFDPNLYDISEQINKIKSEISWYNMLGGSSKKIILSAILKIIGVDKQAGLQAWKMSDFDGFMDGNHPKIYPIKSRINDDVKDNDG